MADDDSNAKRATAPVIKPLRHTGPSRFPKSISKHDADRWRRKDLWSREESAFLLCGYVPDTEVSSRNVRELREAIENIKRAWVAGNLRAVNHTGDMRPTDVIAWADPVLFPQFPFPRNAAHDAGNAPSNGDPEIVLPAGTQRVPVVDIPRLIAEALYPPIADAEEMTISYLQKGTLKHPHGEWLIDEDMSLLNGTIWPHLPPYRKGITATDWRQYEEAFKSAQSPPAWKLLPVWDNPATNNPLARITAAEQHAEMLKAAMRNRQFVPVTHAGMPLPDAFAAHAYATVPALQRYCEGLHIPVRVRVAGQPTKRAEEEPRETEPVKAASRPEEGYATAPRLTRRQDDLTPIIEEVIRTIGTTGGAVSAAAVYPRLRTLAEEPRVPFTGTVNRAGLQWRTTDGNVRYLSKNNLRDRLNRPTRANARKGTR